MTKKHFIELAEMLKSLKYDATALTVTKEDLFNTMVNQIIFFCKRQNPRFNESKFRDYIEYWN